MAKQTINIGSIANDGTGSTLRAAGDLVNDNFNEIYSSIGDGTTLTNILSAGYITASSTSNLTNKSGNISQWTNDSGYLTSISETNDLTSSVTWANVPDANITQSSVTQHQAALSITESQISDLQTYVTASSTNTLTNKTFNANGTGNSISNLEVADFAGSAMITVAETLASNDSDTALVTAGAIIDYVDAQDANIGSDTLTFTNKTFNANGTGNSISNIEVADLASGVLDTDLNSVAGTDTTLASAKAIKTYVDTVAAAGIHYHDPVRVESPSNLNASYDNGTSGVGATLTNTGTLAAITIDGVALNLNDRVLVDTQTNAAHNGIYYVSTVGDGATAWVLTRTTDTDSYGASNSDALGEGDAFFVREGNTGAGELNVMTTSGTITFGTTNITFTVIAETAVYSAGQSLTLSGTEFSVTSSSISSTQLASNAVTTDKISADAINGTKIADDSINSEHYVDGSIDNQHIANSTITSSKLNGAVNLQILDSSGTVVKSLYGSGS
jgi:hypothetical protein